MMASRLYIFVFFLKFGRCQSNNTCWVLSSKNYAGNSKLTAIIGNPIEYLPYMPYNSFGDTNLYSLIEGDVLTNPNVYGSATCDAKNGLLAASKYSGKYGSIIVSQLYFYNATKTDKYDIGHLPLSNQVSGLAFVTNYNFLFWTDSYFKYIGFIDLINLRWKKIVDSPSQNPMFIALHETERYVFWFNNFGGTHIQRSNLLGQNIVSVANANVLSLVIQKQAKRLFWLETVLKSSDFDGNNVISYVISESTLINFAIYEDIIIFGKDTYISSYKFVENNQLEPLTSFSYSDLVLSYVLDSDEFVTEVLNPCLDPSNICEHMCSPQNETNFECSCQFGFLLDGSSCRLGNITDGRLLISDARQGVIYQYDPLSYYVEAILDLYPNQIEHITYSYNSNKEFIYYVLQDSRSVTQYDISTGNNQTFHVTPNDIADIVADQLTGSVYIADVSNIYRVNISAVDVIVGSGTNSIKKLYFHSQKRTLFYSECHSLPIIVQLDIDSKVVVRNISAQACAYSIAIDFDTTFAYYGTIDGYIMKYDLSKNSTTLYYPLQISISDMIFSSPILYITYRSNDIVMFNTLSLTSRRKSLFTDAKDILLVNRKIITEPTTTITSTEPTTTIASTYQSVTAATPFKLETEQNLPVIIGASLAGFFVLLVILIVLATVAYHTLRKKKQLIIKKSQTTELKEENYNSPTEYNYISGNRYSKYPVEYEEIVDSVVSTYDEAPQEYTSRLAGYDNDIHSGSSNPANTQTSRSYEISIDGLSDVWTTNAVGNSSLYVKPDGGSFY